ncbi:MAG TPA: efflux RND transporter periplasmic adaptor subunit [Geminicoccaceae bacterium]
MSIARQLALLAGLAALVIVGWFGGATLFGREGQEIAEEGPSDGAAVPAPVVVQEVRFASDAAILDAVGTGIARAAVELYPEAAGRVTEVLFRAGLEVEAGDPLLRLDAEEEELAVELARVRIDDARQRLERYERAEPSGAVSATEVDAARTQLSAARIELAQAELALRRRTLVAPFAGVAGIPEVDVGDRVSETTTVGTLDDRSDLLVDFEVPEAFAYGVRRGGELTLTTWARPGETFAGRVESIGSRIDEVSRTLRVRAAVPNQEDHLRPGMSFSIRLPLSGDRFPSVPAIAVQWDRDGAFVWRVAGGAAERVFASVLKRSEGWVLLDAPLEAGDRVVVEGVQRLRPGQPVEIVESEVVADAGTRDGT